MMCSSFRIFFTMVGRSMNCQSVLITKHHITIVTSVVSGEKLPWSIELCNASVYSLHNQTTLDVVSPVSIVTSVAVTTRYAPPTSDNIASLGLVLHGDMKTIDVAISKTQVCYFCFALVSAVFADR